MKKIIFLDIDGVLATNIQFRMNHKKFMSKNEWAKELNVPYPFDKGCVKIFNEILEETNSTIILSSDWKLHWNLEQIDIIFKRNGVNQSPEFVTDNDPISFGNLTKNRAWEIEKCIKVIQPEKYVIIDDLWIHTYMGLDVDKFVLTKNSEGLKQIGIKDKIIGILND
jgi:hypothetical protein